MLNFFLPHRTASETYKQPLVFFDGNCHLCSSVVQFLLPRTTNLCFTPLQSSKGEKLLANLGKLSTNYESFVLVESCRVYESSTAALRLCLHMKNPLWRLLYIAILIPAILRNPLYRVIARNRYRIFGRREQCMVAPKTWKDRFID